MRGSRFRPSDEQRRVVRKLAAISSPWSQIAEMLDITEETARRHFAREYATGRAESGAGILAALHRGAVRADRPSIPAAKLLLARLDLGPPPVLGKKEREQMVALDAEAGNHWAGLLNRPAGEISMMTIIPEDLLALNLTADQKERLLRVIFAAATRKRRPDAGAIAFLAAYRSPSEGPIPH